MVRPDVAARVVAPPRGRLTSQELDELTANEALSILHVVRSGSSIPPERRAEHRLASARRLRSFLRDGVFRPLDRPTYLAYRTADEHHTVTALLAEVPVATYEDGHLKPHERLHDEQVVRMADHIDEVGASSLPVLATYRSAPDLDGILEETTAAEPLLDVTVADRPQALWPVPHARNGDVERALSDVHDLYVADGHHRVEAVTRVARRRRARSGRPDPDATHQHLLVALVAVDDLDTAPYHRRLRDPDGTDPTELADRLRAHGFDVTAAGPDPVRPERNGEFGMLVEDAWFHLSAPDDRSGSAAADRVAVSVLHDRILTPVFAVDEPGSDPRVEVVSGAGGVDELVERCRREGGIGFTLPPTDVGAVLDVADEGGTLPPKSTWFLPKLCSGLVLSVIEGLGGPTDRRD